MSEIETEAAESAITCPRCDTRYAEGDSCPVCGALQTPVPCDDDPAREAHSRCVICGRAVCGDIPGERQAALCDQHRTIPVIEGFAQVYSNNDELAARLLVDNLRAEGLDATLYAQTDRSFPVDLGELSIARVLVPTFQAEQALELIADYSDTEGEVIFACPSCGEVFEPGQETCSSCGAPLAG